jgi:hypothetical protein
MVMELLAGAIFVTNVVGAPEPALRLMLMVPPGWLFTGVIVTVHATVSVPPTGQDADVLPLLVNAANV